MEAARAVLFLHPSADLYGADRTLLDLVAGLDRARWRPIVALPKTGPLVDELRRLDVSVEVGPLGVGSRATLASPRGLLALAREIPPTFRFLRRLVRRYDPRLIHTNTMIVLGGALAARLSGVPHVWHVHEILERPRWLARAFAWSFHLLARRVVCNSHATAASFERWCAPLARRAEVVWNGTDEARATRAAPLDRAALGLEPQQRVAILVGRVNSWKGQGLLLEAAAALRARVPDARYLLVGDAPAGQEGFVRELDARIEALGLTDIVVRLPFRDDVAALFGASDVAVVPSTRPEPFGLVALEAMATGTPVVAARHGGVAEVVVDGATGRLFTPGSAEELAAALEELFNDPARAEALGEAGRARQREHFTLAKYVARFDDVYMRALFERPPYAPGSSPPAVVHVVLGKANPARMNGVNQVVHNLAGAQVARGHAAEVWGLTRDPDAATPARPYALRLFRRGARWSLPAGLRRALAELPPTLFHLHGGFLLEHFVLARALRRAGHRYVVTPHGAYAAEALRKNGLAKRVYLALFERRLLAGADAVQAFTETGAREVAQHVERGKVAVVPNGQAPLDAPARAREPGPLRLGFCGRLSMHTKGLDLLLDAFAEHRAAGGGWGELALIGDGPDRAALEARAARLGIADRVTFCGPLFGADKHARLAACDAFVAPSRHEGMPMAVLEAAALGLPLVVTHGTRLASQVRDAGAGFVPEEATSAGLAACLDALAATADRARMGASARALVRDVFGWDTVAARIERSIYGWGPPASEESGARRPRTPPAALPSPSPSATTKRRA